MNRVAIELVKLELSERLRNKWVLLTSLVFAVLSVCLAFYVDRNDMDGSVLAPSLVTLNSLLIPLVALVLGYDSIIGEKERQTMGMLLTLPISRTQFVLAKFVARFLSLTIALLLGFLLSMLFASSKYYLVFVQLLVPSILMGASFLSISLLVSTLSKSVSQAASLIVFLWFGLVLFYDLGLIGLMVSSAGHIPVFLISLLVLCNPAGLYRLTMLVSFSGSEIYESFGLDYELPGPLFISLLSFVLIICPLLLSIFYFNRAGSIK